MMKMEAPMTNCAHALVEAVGYWLAAYLYGRSIVVVDRIDFRSLIVILVINASASSSSCWSLFFFQ